MCHQPKNTFNTNFTVQCNCASSHFCVPLSQTAYTVRPSMQG